MKYIIYCRKSTESDERQALSIPAQASQMQKLAINKGYEVIETLEESKSARVPHKRPIFANLLERIRNREVEGIIVYAINRLSRNWADAGEILQLLTDGVLKEIITPERVITSENSNDILLGVEFGSSSQYSKELSKVVKRGIREKVNRGQYPGNAPYFYINIGTNSSNKTIKPDPETSKHYIEFVDYVITNKPTLNECLDWLNDKGLKTKKGTPFKSKSTVQRLLTNRTYCGYLNWTNLPETKGDWEPLISEEKFKQLQNVLGFRSRPKNFSHQKGYKGLILCEHCGCSITSSHKIKNGKSYIYYHCSKRRGKCPQPYIKEEELETQIFNQISGIQITEEAASKIKEMILERNQEQIDHFKQKKSENKKRIDQIDGMLDQLLDLRLNNEINNQAFNEKKLKLESEKYQLLEIDTDNHFNKSVWIENLDGFLNICQNMGMIFERANIDERKKIVQSIGKNIKMADGTLRWNLRKPWKQIQMINNTEDRSVNYARKDSNL